MPSSIEKIGIFVALAAANADGLKLGGPPRGRARKSSPMGSSARYMCGTHMFDHLAKRVNGSLGAGFDYFYWKRSKTPAVAPETEEMDVVAHDAEPVVTIPGSNSEEYIYGNEFLQLLPAFMMVQYWSNDQKTWISTRLISYGIDKKKDLCGDGHKYYHLTAKEGCFNLDEIRVKRDGFHESKAQANLWLQELGKFKTMLEIEDFIFNKLSWESADKQAVTNFFMLAAIKMEQAQAQQVEMLKVDLEKKSLERAERLKNVLSATPAGSSTQRFHDGGEREQIHKILITSTDVSQLTAALSKLMEGEEKTNDNILFDTIGDGEYHECFKSLKLEESNFSMEHVKEAALAAFKNEYSRRRGR